MPLGKIMKNNPVVAFSKRVNVKLGIATEMTLTAGDEIQQTVVLLLIQEEYLKLVAQLKQEPVN